MVCSSCPTEACLPGHLRTQPLPHWDQAWWPSPARRKVASPHPVQVCPLPQVSGARLEDGPCPSYLPHLLLSHEPGAITASRSRAVCSRPFGGVIAHSGRRPAGPCGHCPGLLTQDNCHRAACRAPHGAGETFWNSLASGPVQARSHVQGPHQLFHKGCGKAPLCPLVGQGTPEADGSFNKSMGQMRPDVPVAAPPLCWPHVDRNSGLGAPGGTAGGWPCCLSNCLTVGAMDGELLKAGPTRPGSEAAFSRDSDTHLAGWGLMPPIPPASLLRHVSHLGPGSSLGQASGLEAIRVLLLTSCSRSALGQGGFHCFEWTPASSPPSARDVNHGPVAPHSQPALSQPCPVCSCD